MNYDSVNFIKPEEPLIIVKQLTQQFIEEAVHEYALNDGYRLKVHQFAGTIKVSILNNLVEEHRAKLRHSWDKKFKLVPSNDLTVILDARHSI